ncbi:MAG: hypothetical protein JO166_10455 [Deltaproteobacteria bacterium]|nr:hypothetical protein [Deltaproteobacteria bacterium]
MSSLPAWAAWSIVVPLVLLSPVVGLLLAFAAEILIVSMMDIGAPAVALVGAGAGGLLLFRALRGSRRAAFSET